MNPTLKNLLFLLAAGALSSASAAAAAAAQKSDEIKYIMIQSEGGCISRRSPMNTELDDLFLSACNPKDPKVLWRFDRTSMAAGDSVAQFRSAMDDSECIQVGERWEINQGTEALQRGTSLYTKRCSVPNRNEFNIAKEAFQAFPFAWSIIEGPLTLDSRPDLCVVHFGVKPKLGESRIMLLECDSLSGSSGRALGWKAVPVDVDATTIVQVPCSQDIFLCPDGSIAHRVAPLCEFESCPSNSDTEKYPPTFFNEQGGQPKPQQQQQNDDDDGEPLIEAEDDENAASTNGGNEDETNAEIDVSESNNIPESNTTAPTIVSTAEPTVTPTASPTSSAPTLAPTIKPTRRWTRRPTPTPTANPTVEPTKREPTREPTNNFAWDAPQYDSEQEKEEAMATGDDDDDDGEYDDDDDDDDDEGLSFACRTFGFFCGDTGLEVRSEEDISPTTLSPTAAPSTAPTSDPSQQAFLCILTTLC